MNLTRAARGPATTHALEIRVGIGGALGSGAFAVLDVEVYRLLRAENDADGLLADEPRSWVQCCSENRQAVGGSCYSVVTEDPGTASMNSERPLQAQRATHSDDLAELVGEDHHLAGGRFGGREGG